MSGLNWLVSIQFEQYEPGKKGGKFETMKWKLENRALRTAVLIRMSQFGSCVKADGSQYIRDQKDIQQRSIRDIPGSSMQAE